MLMVKQIRKNYTQNIMIKERISNLLKEITGKEIINENDSLILDGLLDSFSTMILISKIEIEFGIKIEIGKYELKDLDTINKICEIIDSLKN